jgi:type IX secretion system PorP/SprF family membrane protein
MKILLIIFVVLSLRLAAQDPVFTNTQQSLIHLNPSFAGSNGGLRYQGIYRDQWNNLAGSYTTLYNSVDAYIKPIRGGIGLSYMRDNQGNGILITDRFDLSYAQHLSFLDKKLKIIPSVQFSYFQKTLDQSKLTFGSQIDPRRGFVWGPEPYTRYVTKRHIDLSAGLVVNYNHFYIGGTVFHINQPDEGLTGPAKMTMRLSLFTSYNLFLGDRVLLNAICRLEDQNRSSNLSFSINALFFKHLIVETGLAAMGGHVTLGFRQNYFTICGSYIARDTYEIAASFNLRNKDDRKLVKDFERW